MPEAPAPGPGTAEDSGGTAGLLSAYQQERDGLLAQLEDKENRIGRVERMRDRLRTRLREATNRGTRLERQLAEAAQQLAAVEHDGELFADREQQFRFDVYLSWARRIPAPEKGVLPLGDFEVGPNFFATWDDVAGIDRSKVVDYAMDILTGRAAQLAGRELHALRTGPGAGDQPVVRDRATCWRVNLQTKTPQARRLHYWQRSDGTVELSSVRLHDDFRP